MKNTFVRSAIFASFVVLTIGCAFGNRKVDLTYPPKDYGQYTVDPQLSQKLGIKKIALVVVDKRSGDPKVVGAVRNGFYMRTADVVTEDKVQAWVAKAFTQELQRSGFSVVPQKEAQATLNVAVDSLYANAYWGYSAELILTLNLVCGAGGSREGKIESFGSDGMNWAATSSGYGESLAKALADSYFQARQSYLKRELLP